VDEVDVEDAGNLAMRIFLVESTMDFPLCPHGRVADASGRDKEQVMPTYV